MPFATRSAIVLAATLGLATACSTTTPPAAARPAATAAPAPDAASPTPSAAPGVPAASAAPTSRPASSSTPADVTQDAAARFLPRPTPAVPGGAAEGTPSTPLVDHADPLAVAAGYVATRLTYRYDDPASYHRALTAPAFTTPAFAARSGPSAAAQARLATAHEASAVQVDAAELASEAPNSDTTRYVVVTCTVTTSYREGGGTEPAAWTVRLVPAPDGQWRVNGVLTTD